MPIMKVEEQFEKIQKMDHQRSRVKKIRENHKPSYDRETKGMLIDIFNS